MKTITDFIHEFILPHETEHDHAGNVITENDAADPGGLTKYGIDARSHPGVDIASLTEDQATAIYMQEFCRVKWVTAEKYNFSLLQFPYPAHYVFFDAMVNTGQKQATLFLQRGMGIQADGVVGEITRRKVLSYANFSQDLCLSQLMARESFYHHLAAQKPVMKKFLNGWLNRCLDLEKYIRTI